MKKILFILFTLFSFSISAQAPIKLTSIEQSPDTGMVTITKDTLGKKLQRYAEPRWLEYALPRRNVSIDADNHNFVISNGNIGSFATDTSSNGWILQSYVSKALADGVGKIGGRNYLTGKNYGLDFNGATGTVLSGNVSVAIANEQVQDATISTANSFPASANSAGVIKYLPYNLPRTPFAVDGTTFSYNLSGDSLYQDSTFRVLKDIGSSGGNALTNGRRMRMYGQNNTSGGMWVRSGSYNDRTLGTLTSVGNFNNIIPGRTDIGKSGVVYETVLYGHNSWTPTSLPPPNTLIWEKFFNVVRYTGSANGMGGFGVYVSDTISDLTANLKWVWRNGSSFNALVVDASTNKPYISSSLYPAARNDVQYGHPTNFWGTRDTTNIPGKVNQYSIVSTFPMFTSQNANTAFTGGGTLQDVGNLADVTNENTAVYSSTASTITFLEPGVYDVTMSGVIVSDDVIAAGDEWQVTYSYTGSIAPVIYESAENFPIGDLNRVYFNQTYKIRVTDNSTITPRFLSDTTTDAGTLGFTIMIIKVN